MAKFRFSIHRKNNKSNEKDSLQHVPPLSSWIIRDGNAAAPLPPPKPKKKMGSRLWMRFENSGESELLECDKNVIMKSASLPARDLRILGPIFSHSSNILARERAIVVNLEFIKAIVTAEEVLLLDPLCQEVISFVDQLRQHFPVKSSDPSQIKVENKETQTSIQTQGFPAPETSEGLHHELPFEFQVLEIALEVVCSYLDAKVVDLEKNAYPVLDELARRVSTKNLEHVRSLKSNLTQLLARVQKVRDEIEHLLDDNEDMEHLYLTRKLIQNQQSEALSSSMTNGVVLVTPSLRRLNSNIYSNASLGTSGYSDDHDVEDLEMLLEAYFMQLEGMRNKILSVREYIDDTEDYVNIQLDNQRNEMIQLQLTLIIASFAICIETYIATAFGMNIPCQFYNVRGIFGMFVGGISSVCFFVFLLLLAYARWMKLLG